MVSRRCIRPRLTRQKTGTPMTSLPDTDSISEFAADLRALRLDSESPTLNKLRHDTDISRSVLSDAFAGKKLPSARTVDRIVRALGGDATGWIRRRDALAATTLEPGDDASTEGLVSDGSESTHGTRQQDARPSKSSISRRSVAWIAASAFAVGILLAGGISWLVSSSVVEQAKVAAADAVRKELKDSSMNPRAQINVRNGIDPAMTECVNDAKVATSSPRTNNTLLEIIWSNKCYAGWARITRYDEKITGNSMTVAIYPETAAQGPDRQTATEPNAQSAYTTLVVRPTPQTRLCAVGSITLNGENIDLGEPLCT